MEIPNKKSEEINEMWEKFGLGNRIYTPIQDRHWKQWNGSVHNDTFLVIEWRSKERLFLTYSFAVKKNTMK